MQTYCRALCTDTTNEVFLAVNMQICWILRWRGSDQLLNIIGCSANQLFRRTISKWLLKQVTQLWALVATSWPSISPPPLHSSTPLLFPTHSSFLPCPREHCDRVTIAALCGVCSVCHYPCGRRVEWNKAPKLGYYRLFSSLHVCFCGFMLQI